METLPGWLWYVVGGCALLGLWVGWGTGGFIGGLLAAAVLAGLGFWVTSTVRGVFR